MTRLCHLFDSSATWEHRVAWSYLRDRLPGDRFTQVPAAIAAPRWVWADGASPEALPRWWGVDVLAAPALARLIARCGIDLVHCWGVRAAAAARMATSGPMLVYLCDPHAVQQDAKRLRTIAKETRFAFICSNETVRRRLIENGVDPSIAVVIRPGIDFAAINQAKKSRLRERIGIPPGHRVALVPEPVTREAGQFEAVWAVVLRNHLSGGLQVVVPGGSPERDRIARFVAALPARNPLVLPDASIPFEDLAAISDCLLVTPRGDVSTTAIVWAMAAGCPVIATAVYSVAELISHKVNGLLFKQVPGRSMASAIVKLLDDQAAQQRVREAARGQAYEVFSLRRYLDQHILAYANVLSGLSPSTGIADPARTASRRA